MKLGSKRARISSLIELIYQIRVRLVLARERSERECKLIKNSWFLIRLVLIQGHLIKGSLLGARGAAFSRARVRASLVEEPGSRKRIYYYSPPAWTLWGASAWWVTRHT